MRLVLPWNGYYTMFVAICYYIYNHQMFSYIDYLTGKKLPKWKSSIITFIINYEVFMLISQLRFYLIINWTIFAIFLVLEIAVIYRVPWTMSLFCGIQGAMIGLAFNFITRSGTALLVNQSLAAFDSRIMSSIASLKPYPIAAGFVLAGFGFWVLQHKFNDWAEKEENPDKPVNLIFSLCLVLSLFIYLDLNLLIYFTPSNEPIIKLWGMKSGICVLIGYYIGISHIHTLTKLQHFERQSYTVRKELISHKIMVDKLEKLAFYDILTGCQSREAALNAMKHDYEEGNPFYICFADLNNLKPVNDNLGHDAGDRYLAAVAHALQEAAGTGDIVSRYGGDEFLLITPQDGIERVRAGLDNAKWSLKELSNSSEYPFELWISYGIAFSGECGDLEELIKLADDRMYENKRRDKQERNIGQAGPIPFGHS